MKRRAKIVAVSDAYLDATMTKREEILGTPDSDPGLLEGLFAHRFTSRERVVLRGDFEDPKRGSPPLVPAA